MENQFGTLSQLHLTAAKKEDKTIIEDMSFTAPFKVMYPFYEHEDFMTVMLLTASAGIMAGDRQEFDILVKKHAKMEFVSQAYEKIHKMDEGFAERRTHIRVEPEACLHYTPLPTIPFAGSDYRNEVEVELADETSRFVYSEILTCGRIAHGEEFMFHKFKNRVTIIQDGTIVYRDNTLYEPDQIDMRGFGMYEGFTHLANLIICNEHKSSGWFDEVRSMLEEAEQTEGGATVTETGHIVVRFLGRSGQKMTNMQERILALS